MHSYLPREDGSMGVAGKMGQTPPQFAVADIQVHQVGGQAHFLAKVVETPAHAIGSRSTQDEFGTNR